MKLQKNHGRLIYAFGLSVAFQHASSIVAMVKKIKSSITTKMETTALKSLLAVLTLSALINVLKLGGPVLQPSSSLRLG